MRCIIHPYSVKVKQTHFQYLVIASPDERKTKRNFRGSNTYAEKVAFLQTTRFGTK